MQPKGLHFVQNASYHITEADKCQITLNNKAYMLTAKYSESRRLKKYHWAHLVFSQLFNLDNKNYYCIFALLWDSKRQ